MQPSPTQPSPAPSPFSFVTAKPAQLLFGFFASCGGGCLPIRRAARRREDPVAAAITAPPASPYFLDTVPAPASATAAGRPAW